MAAYKDKAQNTWYTSFYYEDWTGERKRKLKRGFSTKKEALEWEREFLNQKSSNLEMTFESFVEVYTNDMTGRLKAHTWYGKNYIINGKLIPFFGKKKMSEIKPADVIQWQNEMINRTYGNDKKYSPVYLKNLNNQLNAIFNHAVKYYELKANPMVKAGNMGKTRGSEMLFWTKDEYLKFAESMRKNPMSRCAFELLYWCGLRIGELLALTPADFDFEKCTVTINKSFQRLYGEDHITTPKTEKSNRTIAMPDFLGKEIQDYMAVLYKIKPTDRLFPTTKSTMHNEMTRGAKETSVKRIRIHDLRHS